MTSTNTMREEFEKWMLRTIHRSPFKATMTQKDKMAYASWLAACEWMQAHTPVTNSPHDLSELIEQVRALRASLDVPCTFLVDKYDVLDLIRQYQRQLQPKESPCK